MAGVVQACRARSAAALGVVLAAALAPGATAAPQIGYAYPAGGERGTTFVVEVGGQYLAGVDGVRVSGDGVRASVLEYVRTLNNEELGKAERFLRDQVRRRWSARVMAEAAGNAEEPPLPDHPWLRDVDAKGPGELARLQTRFFDPKRQPNAQIAEQVILEVTIDPGAAPGDRELRLLAPEGSSNPLCFQVGVLREVCERDFTGGAAAPLLDPPVLLNGQITPGETDRIRLRLRAGQKLVARLQARRLIPYLADAVPGWFQATISLDDPLGREAAWNDDFRFDPDPVLLYEVPADGVYTLAVRDAIYRGRDDFVYRIAVGELPFITAVFPLGGRAGTPATAAVRGWNLPAETLQLDTRPDSGGDAIRRAMLGVDPGGCSEVSYAVDSLPETAETEPNDETGNAQAVEFPQVVNGRIGRPGDVDGFRFQGRAGQAIVCEVHARRLGSPLDSVLRLTDADGVEVAFNDDCKDPTLGLVTHRADSCVQTELPRDGTYLVWLADAQRQGGDAHAYRLQLRPAQPDFALRLVPSALNVQPGRTVPFTVHALRRDGFDGSIELALVEAPEGFVLSGARVPAGAKSAEVKLSAPRGATRQVFALEIEGRAEIGGQTIRRPGVAAEDMMQAFLWRFLVPRQELLVAVTGSRPVPIVWRPLLPGVRLAGATPVRLPLGGTAQVGIEAPQVLPDSARTPLASVRFRLGNRPRGVTLREAVVTPTGVTLTLKTDSNTALAGDAANVVVEASVEPAAAVAGDQAAGTRGRVSLGVLPAIPYEVVQP